LNTLFSCAINFITVYGFVIALLNQTEYIRYWLLLFQISITFVLDIYQLRHRYLSRSF